MALTDKSLMPFGKFKGKPMEKVPARHLLFLHESGKYTTEVKEYVIDNMDALEKEIKEGKS